MYNYYNNLYMYGDDFNPFIDSYQERSTINKISFLDLNNLIRRLWEEHIIWTRLTIMAIANSSPDLELVSNRLLRNATDFGNLFSKFYSPEISQEFAKLMYDHLTIAADLVVAAKKQDNNAVNTIEKTWHQNADDIAKFLNRINPNWNSDDVKDMMYNHLALTKKEAVAILSNKYADGIKLFDEIESQALMMADDYTEGLKKQFPNGITN